MHENCSPFFFLPHATHQFLILFTVTVDESIAPSAPVVNDTIRFGPGSVSPIVTYPLLIMDDNVTLEGPEIFTLVLSSPSHMNIQIGGEVEGFDIEWYDTTTVTILDDDGEFIALS